MTVSDMVERSGISRSNIQRRLKAFTKQERIGRNEDFHHTVYDIIKIKENFKLINNNLVYIGA